ncbi:spore coat protein U domain-containing protein, partial [Trinickia sp.]
GSGNTDALILYGHIPAQTTPLSGTYSDTVTATISF